MFNPFKKKSKRPTETRATHFVGRIFNRYGAPAAQRCGTKNSGLFMELQCPDFTVTIRAEHIEGHDYVRVHRVGAAENGIALSELVNVIVDKREPETPVAPIAPVAPMKIVGSDDIGGREC